MNYNTMNGYVLIDKKEDAVLKIAGQDENPNAILHGTVVKTPTNYPTDHTHDWLQDKKVVFVRGNARKINLKNKEYYIIKEDKILLWQK